VGEGRVSASEHLTRELLGSGSGGVSRGRRGRRAVTNGTTDEAWQGTSSGTERSWAWVASVLSTGPETLLPGFPLPLALLLASSEYQAP